MTPAVALAVVLVIAVAGLSLALQTQRPVQQSRTAAPRRVRERRPTPPPPPEPAPEPTVATSKGPELLRTGVPAQAKVISVVDERTLGPVTRSRLSLQVEPGSGASFEVTIRVAFPTPEARAKVRVGGTVAVRFDQDDHSRVVLDPGDVGSS